VALSPKRDDDGARAPRRDREGSAKSRETWRRDDPGALEQPAGAAHKEARAGWPMNPGF
jgi:hypothetical protein